MENSQNVSPERQPQDSREIRSSSSKDNVALSLSARLHRNSGIETISNRHSAMLIELSPLLHPVETKKAIAINTANPKRHHRNNCQSEAKPYATTQRQMRTQASSFFDDEFAKFLRYNCG